MRPPLLPSNLIGPFIIKRFPTSNIDYIKKKDVLGVRKHGRMVKIAAIDGKRERLLFKTHSRHSAVSLEKTLYGIFLYLAALTSCSNFQPYL